MLSILTCQLELKIKVQNLNTEPELLEDMKTMIITMFMELIFLLKLNFQIKFNLQFAGRYDKYPQVGESSFAPRAALVYNQATDIK